MALGWYGWRTGSNSALPFGLPSPELGISETINDARGYSRNSQGGSTLSQSIAQPNTYASGQNYSSMNYSPFSSSGGSVLGTSQTSTSGSGSSSVTSPIPAPTPSTDTSYLDLIRSRLDEAKRRAGALRSEAQTTLDQGLNYVRDQYGNLVKRIGEKKTNALGTLDQEGTSLNNLYARARNQARTRAAGAETKNRMRARAMNRLDSSFYDDIQAGNTSDLVKVLGDTAAELTGKQTGLNTRKTETNQYYDNLEQDTLAEQLRQEQEQQAAYRRAQEEANALENSGVLDYGQDVAAAGQTMQGRLDSILQFIQNAALQKMQIDALAGNRTNLADSFQAISPALQSILAQSGGLAGSQGFIPQLMGVNPGNNTIGLDAILAMLGQKRPDQLVN